MLPLFFILLIAVIVSQVESATNCDLKSIFRTPTKRNYDQFEILERSNFDSDESASTPSNRMIDKPKSFANAQIMLRFGESDKASKGCACGDLCQCKSPPPYYHSMLPPVPPIPHCYCVPYNYPPLFPFYPYNPQIHPLHQQQPWINSPQSVQPVDQQLFVKPVVEEPIIQESTQNVAQENSQTNQVSIVQNNNIDNRRPQVFNNNIIEENVEITNNHPQILNTVRLPEPAVTNDQIEEEILMNGIEENIIDEVSQSGIINKITPTSITPNVKFVTVDLKKVSKGAEIDRSEFDDCLIPYVPRQQNQPKLLVSYPIFKGPQNNHLVNDYEIQVPKMVNKVSKGYSLSKASGYYSDPTKTLVYKQPTVLSIIGPQRTQRIVGDGNVKYVLVPVPQSQESDCACYSCARYVGELNEKHC